MKLANDTTISMKRGSRRRSPDRRVSSPAQHLPRLPTSGATSMPDWNSVRPGDWIRAASAHGAGVIQGVVETVHAHPEYGRVVSVNDTRRTVMHWRLWEVRRVEELANGQ